MAHGPLPRHCQHNRAPREETTGEGTTQHQLESEPDQTLSQRTDYSVHATYLTASNTTRQCTPSLDRTEYSQNMDYSHMPRRNTNDINSPSNGGRGRAPHTYGPNPTHKVYSAEREKTRHIHAATQGHANRCPKTAGTAGLHGQREAGGQSAQRRLDPEQNQHQSQRTDYSDRTTNRTTNTTPCRRTTSDDRTEYSAQNTDHCGTPQHEAQHHSDQNNPPRPEPQTMPLVTKTKQPSAPEDHTHEAPLSVSSVTSDTAIETHSQLSTPPEAPQPPLESLPNGLDASANQNPMDPNNDSTAGQHPTRTAGSGRRAPTTHMEPVPGTQRNRATDNGNRRKPRPGGVHPGTAKGHAKRPATIAGRSDGAGRGNQGCSLDEPRRSPARAGGPDRHPRIRRPTASNPRGNSGGSRPDPAQLDTRPHHRPA